MSDVLVLTIALRPGLSYPSANNSVRGPMKYGAKTDDYAALAFDVEEAGRQAVEAGWEPIRYPCRAWITRYSPLARVFDAFNLGQCEANALTKAGVWTDDELGRPATLDYQPRSDGDDRVVIVIQRLPPPLGVQPREARPRIAKRQRGQGARPERVEYKFTDAPASAPPRGSVRSLDDIPSGTVITDFAERDLILNTAGVRPAPPKGNRSA